MNEDILYGMAAVLAVLLGGITILIPVVGLTLRFALRPVLETWARLRSTPTPDSQTELLTRQMSLLEAELQQVQHAVQGLVETQDFQRSLQGERKRQ
ncbi:MAG TPA: hypothetical protein VFZ18_04705 [Longimicrobiaceae bacterium]|jgi:hypothetical protein